MDKLNNIQTKYEPIDYNEYFGTMSIPQEDIEKRVELAEEIDDTYYGLFALILSMIALGEALDRQYLYGYVQERISEVTERYKYPYLAEYASTTSVNAVDTTLDHIGEEYYTSDERASRLAAENAQTIANYSELQEAIDAGYTHKTWVAEIDRRTRDEHREMNGKTIPIGEFFHFSDCDMVMPHDEIYGSARQCANCRCSLSYNTRGDEDKDAEEKDVTKEYANNARPNEGRFTIEDGFRDQNGELNMGHRLYETFGGNIYLLAENHPNGESNPDYLWKDRLWDLKTPNSTGNISKLVQKGIHQILNNPGGVVVDYSKIDISLKDLEEIVRRRVITTAKFNVDVLFYKDGDFVKAVRYKK